MLRYFALIWNPHEPVQRETADLLSQRLKRTADAWETILDDSGIRVFCASRQTNSYRAYTMLGQSGVVLGTLFTRDSLQADAQDTQRAPTTFSERESQDIIASGGRRLVKRYWGRYVAFLQDRGTDAQFVLRDPCGGIACYSARLRDVHLYFSTVEDCIRLQAISLSVDWSMIADHLCIGAVRSRETALKEVTEVYPGDCVRLHRNAALTLSYWEPHTFINNPPVESPHQAAVELRRTVRRCICAWASCFDGLLLKLSGGLDSSIVLACLADAPSRPKLTCLNYYAHTSDSDERAYAIEAAKRVGVPLIERAWNGHVPLEAMLDFPCTPRPIGTWGQIQHARFERALAREAQATAIFGGEGGDEHFYQTNIQLTAADYAFRHGLKRELFTVALNAAYCTGTSIWSVLRATWRHGFFGKLVSLHAAPGKVEPLLDRSLIEQANSNAYRRHPWLNAIRDLPAGKIWQMYALSLPAAWHSVPDERDELDRVEPFEMSQPLTELCLGIPTYVLARDGLDRAIARGAFAQDLPPSITFRHAKGGPEDGMKALFIENLPFIRELLLDGILVGRKLLNRSRLEAVLATQPSPIHCGVGEIFSHLSTEAWLRRSSLQA